MAIQTVCGPVDPKDVGFSLLHEHLHADFWTNYCSAVLESGHAEYLGKTHALPLTLETLGYVRRDPRAIGENLILTDVELTTRELTRYKQAGGSLIVDATTAGASPSPVKLRKMSQDTGVHIVSSTGYYISTTLSEEAQKLSVAEMAKACIRDITEGYEGLDIKAGFIGEVGAVGEMDDLERRILESTAIAQKETGACVSLHTACPNTFFASKYKRTWGERVLITLDFLRSHGADLSRVIVGHADVSLDTTVEEQLRVLEQGVVIEYDNLGQEHPYDEENTYGITDWTRMEHILEFISRGYEKQIVMAQDVWQRAQYIEYGGWGFGHILQNFCPMLLRNGVTPAQIEQMTVLTPRRLLNK